MSQPNNVVPQPNFLGGFLCGFLGILAFAWLGNYAMWTAGALGFVTGCWPKQLLASVTSTYQACVRYAPGTFKSLFGFIRSNILRAANHMFGSPYRRLYFLRVMIVLLVLLPLFIFILGFALCLLSFSEELEHSPPILGIGAVFAFVAALLFSSMCLALPLGAMICGGDLDLPDTEARYKRSWVLYLRSMHARREDRGLLYCLGYDVVSTLKRQLVVAFMFVFGTIAGMLLFTSIGIVTLFVLVVRGLILLNSRASGVICLAIALAITTCSAWTMADYLTGALLWAVALATGCVAGSTSVATRKLVTHTFPRLADGIRAFSEQTVASRTKPLAALWLKPEKALSAAALALPEQV